MLRTAIAVLMLAAGAATAAAQTTVRYFSGVTGLLEELDSDVIIKETRSGPRIVAAELDICHARAANSPLRERVVVTLKPQGNRLVGAGRSQESGTPVGVDLVRSGSTGSIAFEGTIKYGDRVFQAASSDNADMSAKEFEEQSAAEETIVENPSEFREVTPGTVAIRVQRTALSAFLASLRAERIKLQTYSVMPSCDALRRGTLDVQIDVDPERAPALVAKARGMQGVTRSGWTSGGIELTRAVRLAAAGWRDADGRLEREKLGKAIADVAARTMNARRDTAEWDEITGELSVLLKRADTMLPGLGLVETIEIPVVVSADMPAGKDRLVIRIGQVLSEVADEGEGPRLTLSANQSGNDAVEPEGSDSLQAALARVFKGEIWDAEKEAWTQP